MDSQNQSSNSLQNQVPSQTNYPADQPVQNNSSDDSDSPDNSGAKNISQDDNTHTDIPLPPEAGDADLIEKEWVERAKQIVEHTREDPYEQQRALSQMKADYLKKRYDKDIKIAED